MSYLVAEDPIAIYNAFIIELYIICVHLKKKGGGGQAERGKKTEKDWDGGRFNRPLNKGKTHNIIKNGNNYSTKQTLETHVKGLKFSPGPHSVLYQRQRSPSLLKKIEERRQSSRRTDRSSVKYGEEAGQGMCFLVSVLISVYGRHQYRHCMRRRWGMGEEMGKGFKVGQHKWNRRYFCPLMDCDIDRGGIMSKRYSRCRSAKLGALCPPMPVFKYAILTPGIPRRPPGTDN